MGKKKTPVFRNGADNEINSTKNDKINAIRTWDDVEHDSEDECKLNFESKNFERLIILFSS
jgi:hypothetical protein